jgi:hypothetical protein
VKKTIARAPKFLQGKVFRELATPKKLLTRLLNSRAAARAFGFET